MSECKCENCGHEFKPNEGLYNTPSGLFCCNCYDNLGMKKKVWDEIKKQSPLAINLGKMALLSVGIDDRPKNTTVKYKFVRVIINDVLMPSWYFVCDKEVDVYYFFEKYYAPIIHDGVARYMRGDYNTYWGNTILRLTESPKYRHMTACTLSSTFENEMYANKCDSVKNGEIQLFNKNDMRYFTLNSNVKIIQEKYADNLTFPDEQKYDINDIVIKRWDNGIHYYAKIGKYDIISHVGQVKYNSYSDAHAECLKWLENQ